VWFWIKRGFGVPRYIHAIALAAALVGIGVVFIQPRGESGAAGGIRDYLFAALVFPGLVYATFVFFGGAQAALDAKGHPLPHDGSDSGESGQGEA